MKKWVSQVSVWKGLSKKSEGMNPAKFQLPNNKTIRTIISKWREV